MSTQLIKPNYLVIFPPTQHHSFFRNLPPLFEYFVAELKTLAKKCNFCDCLCDSLIRDRIVFGIKDRQTTEKLLRIGGWGNAGVLSMPIPVILDSPFARPDSAPIGGGKKGEFWDWTMLRLNGMENYLSRLLPNLFEVMKPLRELIDHL